MSDSYFEYTRIDVPAVVVLQGWTPEGMNACKAPPAYEGICRQFVVVAGSVVTKNDCKCGEPSDRF